MEGPPLRITLLGAFRVHVGGRPVPDSAWRLRKSSAIVKLLALVSDFRLAHDQIYDALWPELSPAAARNNLNYAVYAARRALGSAGALTNNGKVIALPETTLVDAADFAHAAGRAQLGEDANAALDAIQLYGGELLPEDRYEEWAAGPRERLRDLFLSLLLRAAAEEERTGEPSRAAALLERGLVSDPTHEEIHTALMLVYARMGRPSQARRQFEQLCDVLRRDLECEPHPATVRIHEAIQRGDVPAAPTSEDRAASDAETRRRDAAYYLRLAQDLAPRTLGPDGHVALARLERESARFDETLAWAVEMGEVAWGLLLAAELVALWNLRGRLSEGREWIARLLALPEPPPEAQARAYLAARAHGLSAAAGMARIQGEAEIAREYQVAAQEIRARLGDRRGVAESMVALGFMDLSLGKPARARAGLEEALVMLREGDEPRMVAVALIALARAAQQEGALNEAERLAAESLAAYERHGDRYGSTGALTTLGALALERGDVRRAASILERCLALGRELRFPRATAASLMLLGSVALRSGDRDHAKALFKDSAAMFRQAGLREDLATCESHLAALAESEQPPASPQRPN